MSGTSWNVCKAYKFTYLACIYGKSNNGAPWGLSAVSTVDKTLNLKKKLTKKGRKSLESLINHIYMSKYFCNYQPSNMIITFFLKKVETHPFRRAFIRIKDFTTLRHSTIFVH